MRKQASKPPEDESRKEDFRKYLRFSTLGIEMGVSLVIGLLVGWFLDRLFHTEPWLMLLFFVFGIAAGFKSVIRLAQKDWGDLDNE